MWNTIFPVEYQSDMKSYISWFIRDLTDSFMKGHEKEIVKETNKNIDIG